MASLRERRELLPLQRGIAFECALAGHQRMSLVQREYVLEGDLCRDALERAWQVVADRHALLRCSIHIDRGRTSARVAPTVPVALHHEDWSALSAREQDDRIEDFCRRRRLQGLDLAAPPLFRGALFRTGPREHRMVWTLHELLMDRASATALVREVVAVHGCLRRGEEPPSSSLRGAGAYAAWLRAQPADAAEAYWRAELEGLESPTHLGLDRSPTVPLATITEHGSRQRRLSVARTRALRDFGARHGLAASTLFEGAWAVLLSCCSGRDDVAFGVEVSARSLSPAHQLEPAIGLLANIAPARVRVPLARRLVPWLAELEIGGARRQVFAHWPLVQIKRWSEIAPGLPLFESLLLFEEPPARWTCASGAGDVSVSERPTRHAAPAHPLTVRVVDGDRITVRLDHDASRFDADAVERILSGLESLLAAFEGDCSPPLAELSIVSPAEREQIVVEWNRVEDNEPLECVHRQIERQAALRPHAPAVTMRDQTLSYRELDERASQLAHLLIDLGAAPGARIGLCLERSPSMVVAVLAILKTGCAYVPFDPALPDERLLLLLADSSVSVVVVDGGARERAPGGAGGPIWLAVDDARLASQPRTSPGISVPLDATAYVIYTSGSTGRPKGVLVPHRGVANFIGHAACAFEIRTGDRFLQFASISFDTAAEEIYTPLISGATLVLRTDEMLGSVSAFLQACRERGITVMDLPTAYWHVVVEALDGAALRFPDSVRMVIIGGEGAKPEQLATWFARQGERPVLVNTYGPTEASIACTGCVLRPSDAAEVPIGRPIRDVQAFVLDWRAQPVPVGVPGELTIAGAGLADGYLHRPDLTAERFVPDPFAPRPGARMYRTGDVVKWRPDGSLIFVGRADRQVKFRGYRIELQEIEAIVAKHDRVRQAVVLLRSIAPDGQRLVAYVVTDPDDPVTPADLRAFLAERMPAHMIPGAIVALPALPLNSRGKIDARALPDPSDRGAGREPTASPPRTPVERQIAAIWGEVLGLARVGVRDRFFDLGGTSLDLVRVRDEIEARLDVRLSVAELVLPNVEQLAALCEQRRSPR